MHVWAGYARRELHPKLNLAANKRVDEPSPLPKRSLTHAIGRTHTRYKLEQKLNMRRSSHMSYATLFFEGRAHSLLKTDIYITRSISSMFAIMPATTYTSTLNMFLTTSRELIFAQHDLSSHELKDV